MTENRVLHIAATSFFSDDDSHIRMHGIVRCLEQLGYDNLVCTYHHGRDMPGIKTSRINSRKNHDQVDTGVDKGKIQAGWRLLWLCIKHYRVDKPIAIHAHLHKGLLIGWLIKVIFFWQKTLLISDVQSSLCGELEARGIFERYGFLRGPARMFERTLMKAADFVICPSQRSLGMLTLQFSIPDDRISLVQDGADKVPKISEQRRHELLEKHGISENKKIVVYSGALIDIEGLVELKQLICDSAELADIVHFVIIGCPTKNLRAHLQEFELEAICSVLGRIEFEQLADYLSLADIAVDPNNASSSEGRGKLINYMAAGLPIVAYDTSNNAEILPQGSPLAVNQQQLSGQLRLLLSDAGLCADFAEQNMRRFEQSYSWQIASEQLKSVYDKILEPSSES